MRYNKSRLSVMPEGNPRNSNDVAIPKFPPPPRRPQKRSGFSAELAFKNLPSAVTTLTESRLSQARPCLRTSHPKPPPSVRPGTPVEEIYPPVAPKPKI